MRVSRRLAGSAVALPLIAGVAFSGTVIPFPALAEPPMRQEASQHAAAPHVAAPHAPPAVPHPQIRHEAPQARPQPAERPAPAHTIVEHAPVQHGRSGLGQPEIQHLTPERPERPEREAVTPRQTHAATGPATNGPPHRENGEARPHIPVHAPSRPQPSRSEPMGHRNTSRPVAFEGREEHRPGLGGHAEGHAGTPRSIRDHGLHRTAIGASVGAAIGGAILADHRDRRDSAGEPHGQGPGHLGDQPEHGPDPGVGGRPLRGDLHDARYSGPGGHGFVVPTNDRVRVVTRTPDVDWGQFNRRVPYRGCPPGMAQAYPGCQPPLLSGQPTHAWDDPDWYWTDYDRDHRYRYAGGYLLELDATSQVLSYIPLLGGALAIGADWPGAYDPVALPPYYADYYGLGPATGYRYYGNTIFTVNPAPGANAGAGTKITGIAALMTGNTIAIGKPMPLGYEIYNVPFAYRDQYVDGPEALYRYSDGYIYQLDPTTRRVKAAIELLG